MKTIKFDNIIGRRIVEMQQNENPIIPDEVLSDPQKLADFLNNELENHSGSNLGKAMQNFTSLVDAGGKLQVQPNMDNQQTGDDNTTFDNQMSDPSVGQQPTEQGESETVQDPNQQQSIVQQGKENTAKEGQLSAAKAGHDMASGYARG